MFPEVQELESNPQRNSVKSGGFKRLIGFQDYAFMMD